MPDVLSDPGPVVSQTFRGVPLLKTGTYNALTGPITFTADDLAEMVEESRDPTMPLAHLKLGHLDPRFRNAPMDHHDADPALGTVRNLRISSDGQTLLGDFVDVPSALANRLQPSLPQRSIEARKGLLKPDGTKRGWALTALALLGVAVPAVSNLGDIFTVTASAGGDTVVAADSDTNDIPQTTPASADPSPVPNGTPNATEANMPDQKTPEELAAEQKAADDAAAKVQADADAKAAADKTAADEAAKVAAAAAPALPEGTVLIDATVLAQLTAGAQAGVTAQAELDTQRRDGIIEAALRAGKITPASAEATWKPKLLEGGAVEAATVVLLASLPDGIVPVDPSGHGEAVYASAGGTDEKVFEPIYAYLTSQEGA